MEQQALACIMAGARSAEATGKRPDAQDLRTLLLLSPASRPSGHAAWKDTIG